MLIMKPWLKFKIKLLYVFMKKNRIKEEIHTKMRRKLQL